MKRSREYYEQLFIRNYTARFKRESGKDALPDSHAEELKEEVESKSLDELKNLVHFWCI